MRVLEGLQRHSDSRGRHLADLFYRLPTPEDLPEYYRLIPRPVDLAGINSRLLGGEYATSGDLAGRCKLRVDPQVGSARLQRLELKRDSDKP